MNFDVIWSYTYFQTNPDPISERMAVESGQTWAEPGASELIGVAFLESPE